LSTAGMPARAAERLPAAGAAGVPFSMPASVRTRSATRERTVKVAVLAPPAGGNVLRAAVRSVCENQSRQHAEGRKTLRQRQRPRRLPCKRQHVHGGRSVSKEMVERQGRCMAPEARNREEGKERQRVTACHDKSPQTWSSSARRPEGGRWRR